MLLNRIDTVTSELNEAKREQEILISNVSQKEGASALQEQYVSDDLNTVGTSCNLTRFPFTYIVTGLVVPVLKCAS